MRYLTIILYAIVISSTYSWGQSDSWPFYQGTTINTVETAGRYNYFIDEDSYGFTWISSNEGAIRFDGLETTVYGPDRGLLGKNIQSHFFEDRTGDLWFSTIKSLHRYERARDTLHAIELYLSNGERLPRSDTKPFYYHSGTNRLWLLADGRICNFDLSRPDDCTCQKELSNGFGFYVVRDLQGNPVKISSSPWLNGVGVTLYDLFHGRADKYLSNIKNIIRTVPFADSTWLALSSKHLYRFREGSDHYDRLPLPNDLNYLDLQYDSTMSAWLLSSGKQGIFVLNQDFSLKPLLAPPSRIEFIHPERNRLWMNFKYGNAGWIDRATPPFERLVPDSTDATVVSMVATATNELYLGTAGSKFYGVQLTDSHLSTEFIYGGQMGAMGMTVTSEGLLLFVVGEKLVLYDSKNRDFPALLNSGEYRFRRSTRLNSGRILAYGPDGIYELKKQADQYLVEEVSAFRNSDEFQGYQIYPARGNRFFLVENADFTNLHLYEEQNQRFIQRTTYQNVPLLYNLVPGRYDPDMYWAATQTGLKTIRDTTVEFVTTRHDMLRTESIHGVVEDDRGNLWLSSENGLINWHPETDELYRYYASDGLSGNKAYRYNNILRLPDGRIALATDNGITLFHPDSIRPHREPPHVHLESLLINDQRNITAPGFQTAIELAYYEDNLLFELLSVTLFRPERARILYQMEGYDDRPVEVERGQLIRYVQMPPGQYTFRAQAIDDNGNRSAWLTLPVRIRPPWWQTWWFYALLSVSALTAAILFYRHRLRTLRRKEAVKRQLVELELQVAENELKALRAQMNPHFLFNVMNSIKSIIIARQTDRSIHYLTQLSKLIRTILANSEKKLISLDRELEALKLYIQLEALRFDDDFDYSVLLGDDIETDFIRIPPLILQPFAENAIRHGLVPRKGLRRLKLHIYREGDFVLFEMEDNGIGRAAAARESRARTGHHSMGLDITRRRLQLADARNDFHFVDLTDGEKRPVGTRVVLRVWWGD